MKDPPVKTPPIKDTKQMTINTIQRTTHGTPSPQNMKTNASKTKKNTPTKSPTAKSKTITTKTKTSGNNTKFANHPDYEFDTIKKRWVKKSDIRPIELVNRYKTFLIDYLKKHTEEKDHKNIEKIVNKYATSTERLKEILIEKEGFSRRWVNRTFDKYNFWDKELCGHMKKVCPNETDLSGKEWCEYGEDLLFLYKEHNGKHVSCYSITDVYDVISSSFTGGDDDVIFLQLPRDPYTRKVWDQDFIKKFLKQLRVIKKDVNRLPLPHVVYFLRNYKKFYADPQIKPFLKKNTLTKREQWQLSDAIEDFMLETEEIGHGFTDDTGELKRWWFWEDDTKIPKDLYNYIFNT
jgi:hypothetical protein